MPGRFFIVWLKLLLVFIGAGLCAFLIFLYKRAKVARLKDSFKCHNCGNCCRLKFISLTDDEIDRIKKLGYEKFCEKHTRWGNVMKRVNGECYFLENNLCRIYKDRPHVCREFPFGKFLGLITYCRNAKYCPGIKELEEML